MTDSDRGARAGEDLRQIARSRAAAASVTRRPAWIDAGMSVALGLTVGLGLTGHIVAALVVLALGTLGVLWAQRVFVRRRGQVLDQRAIGARMWRFALVYPVLAVLGMVDVPSGWQPWFALGAAALVAGVSYAWLRWDDRYQAGRLARGDFGRYDLL